MEANANTRLLTSTRHHTITVDTSTAPDGAPISKTITTTETTCCPTTAPYFLMITGITAFVGIAAGAAAAGVEILSIDHAGYPSPNTAAATTAAGSSILACAAFCCLAAYTGIYGGSDTPICDADRPNHSIITIAAGTAAATAASAALGCALFGGPMKELAAAGAVGGAIVAGAGSLCLRVARACQPS